MGDAFDDWLIEKIQLLRKGTAVASAINRVEQVSFVIIPCPHIAAKHLKQT